jgi:hypothetical protein
MARTRLIVELITPHRTYLTITKTRKGTPRPDPGCSATDDDDKITEGKITMLEFQYRLIKNLISEYHRTEVRPSGRTSKTAPPTTIYAATIHCCYSFQAEPTSVLQTFQELIAGLVLSVSQPHVAL